MPTAETEVPAHLLWGLIGHRFAPDFVSDFSYSLDSIRSSKHLIESVEKNGSIVSILHEPPPSTKRLNPGGHDTQRLASPVEEILNPLTTDSL